MDKLKKKTVIVGASTNPGRYSHLAADLLTQYGHEIVPLSIHPGAVSGKTMLNLRQKPMIDEVDTVTLYINPVHQAEWEDYILSLKPRRIIFNPGAENPEFETRAERSGMEVIEGCTLVMLRSGQF
jgi:predicted CoA-binding protein